jgi:TonB family protein
LSEEKKYKKYTAADIEKYHKGSLTPKEMNELEKAALDDPFLADALEGYAATATNILSDVSELKKKLEERVSDRKVISMVPPGSSFKWWKVAAAVVILGGLGYFVFQISTGNKNKEIATTHNRQNRPQAPVGDSNKLIDSPRDSALDLRSNTQSVTGENEQAATAKTPKENSISKDFTGKEISKSDLSTEKRKASQPAQNDSEPKDSLDDNRLSGVTAPAAIEKKSAADYKLNEGVISNNQLKANYFNGRIKDANNNPLPFANITNTRDDVGTYADAQGRFTLVSPDSVLDVQVRSVGFENSTVQLKNNVASNDVVLQENKTVPEKVLGVKKPDASRSKMANIQTEELEPADGWSNYNTYLANNTSVPEDAKSKEIAKGQVQLSFEVNQQGSPVNIRVEKSLCDKCDEEAVRVVKQGPKWKKKNKKAKRITITVPFDTEQ